MRVKVNANNHGNGFWDLKKGMTLHVRGPLGDRHVLNLGEVAITWQSDEMCEDSQDFQVAPATDGRWVLYRFLGNPGTYREEVNVFKDFEEMCRFLWNEIEHDFTCLKILWHLGMLRFHPDGAPCRPGTESSASKMSHHEPPRLFRPICPASHSAVPPEPVDPSGPTAQEHVNALDKSREPLNTNNIGDGYIDPFPDDLIADGGGKSKDAM